MLTIKATLGFTTSHTTEVKTVQSNSHQTVVLVTGASRGIGLVIAEYLAKQGHIVYGTIRASSDTIDLDRAVKLYNGHLFKVVVSLTDENEITQATAAIFHKHGKIDVLINNAAYVLAGTVESCTIDEQIELFNMNYFGPVRTIQAVLPYMRSQKSGMIINIGSVFGMPLTPHGKIIPLQNLR